MDALRREFLKRAGIGMAAAASGGPPAAAHPPGTEAGSFDVRRLGATGDSQSIDTAAVNHAIDAAAAAGGFLKEPMLAIRFI